jgi:signal transduction histidine kinase
MRERVEILGGSFELNSAPKQGTTIRVILPLVVPGVEHE